MNHLGTHLLLRCLLLLLWGGQPGQFEFPDEMEERRLEVSASHQTAPPSPSPRFFTKYVIFRWRRSMDDGKNGQQMQNTLLDGFESLWF